MNYSASLLLISLVTMWPLMAAELQVFDGSKREILYQTSSHRGDMQLQEMLQLVPGGLGMTVIKMPYGWGKEKSAPGYDEIRRFPVIIARLNNNFGSDRMAEEVDQHVVDGSFQGTFLTKMVADIDESIARRLKRDQPTRWIGISGHYHQREDPKVGTWLLAKGKAYERWQADNPRPHAKVINTLPVLHQHHPLTVKNDFFHTSPLAGYLEGLEIVKALCAYDGIELPAAVPALVAEKVASAADQHESFTLTISVPGTETTGHDPRINIGGSINVSWSIDNPEVQSFRVLLHQLGKDDYLLGEPIKAKGNQTGKLTWVIPEAMPSIGNNHLKVKDLATRTAGRMQPIDTGKRKPVRFCFRIVDLANPSRYTFSPSFIIERQ